MRDLINEHLNGNIPDHLRQRLAALGIDAEDLAFGDLIAMRLVAAAAAGDSKAIEQILGSEPKGIAAVAGPPPRSPDFIPSEDEQAALARMLDGGLLDEVRGEGGPESTPIGER
jgi:hypothetical protein